MRTDTSAGDPPAGASLAHPTAATAGPGRPARSIPAGVEAIAHLEALVVQDPGRRGVGALRVPGALAHAARALANARHVLITTGFPRDGKGETDGPPGAAALGRALIAIGVGAVHVTDRRNALLLAALDLAPEVVELAVGDRAGAERLLARLDPSHLVAIERPGRSADGTYRNMRGVDIGATTCALDEPFLLALEEGPWRRTTIAVGDGGNEVGMGTVSGRVSRAVLHGERIASVVAADHLVVAGVSTWGAWGIVAGLSLHVGHDLLPTDEQVVRDIDMLIAAGAVDGVTGRSAATIDGLPLETSLDVLRALRAAIS